MANGSTNEYGTAVSPLTALLEDTAELAFEGPSLKLDPAPRRHLVRDIDVRLKDFERVIKEIKTAL